MYAPCSALAVVTTVDAAGNVDAAALGACARIAHDPVAIMFTIGIGRDTADNVLATGQFVVNIPAFAPDELRALCLTGTAGEQRAGSRRTDRDGRPRREAAAHRRVQPPL